MNHRITTLTLQKNNPQRVNVYLDGQFAFGLARILAAWLKVGQEISDEKIDQLRAEDRREVAFQRALKYLSYRPRSQAEIRQHLQKHQVSETEVEQVLERLRQSGLVDDQKFATLWVENRLDFHPKGRRALVYELRQRGIDEDTIEQTLQPLDESQLAYQAAVEYARRIKHAEWKEFRQKLYRHLLQRGFSYETISEAVNRIETETTDSEFRKREEETP